MAKKKKGGTNYGRAKYSIDGKSGERWPFVESKQSHQGGKKKK